MYRLLVLVVALAALPGCGAVTDLFDFLSGGSPETGSAKLLPFTTEKEFVDYFSGQIDAQGNLAADERGTLSGQDGVFTEGSSPGSLDPAALAPPTANLGDADTAAPTDTDFSQTTIQEQGVDEPDVVKTDGTYMYIINGGTLRIVRVSPAEQLAELATVQLAGSGRDIFLHDNKVVALTETGFFFGGGGFVEGGFPILGDVFDEAVSDVDIAVSTADEPPEPSIDTDVADIGIVEPVLPPVSSGPTTFVTIIDISTPESPTILSTTGFEGSPSASRMIDGVLHLVVSNFQNYFFDILPRFGAPEVDTPPVESEEILPTFSRMNADGEVTTGTALTWRELYRPTDPDGYGVVTLVSLDVDDDAAFTAVGIVAEPGLVYASLNAMYLTDTEFNAFGDSRETTDIYKFAFVGRGAVPVATGSVPGRILNQYSMGEFAAHLRVATTTFSGGTFRFQPGNNVYALAQTDDELTVVGSVENIAPGETIQSARFIGDRGFVVTFRQIDPFFTLDLADPTNLRVIGELKVPGFSTLIIPMDENHLLTVGQYIPENDPFFTRGVQLSIFDVTKFDEPRLSANVILGADTGASSEALFNPKAFTYFAEKGLVALPISIFEGFFFNDIGLIGVPIEADDSTQSAGSEETVEPGEPGQISEPAELIAPVPQGFEGVVVFDVSVEGGFTELGRISTRFEDAGIFWSSFTRGVFIGDKAYAVTNNGLRGGMIDDLADQPFELIFSQTDNAPIAVPLALP